MTTATRTCAKCGETKPFEDFPLSYSKKHGPGARKYSCRKCDNRRKMARHKVRMSEDASFAEKYRAKKRAAAFGVDHRPASLTKRVCRGCGVEFLNPTWGGLRYHSDECRESHQRAEQERKALDRAASLPIKKCATCGNDFAGRNVTCSPECWNARRKTEDAKRRRRLRREEPERVALERRAYKERHPEAGIAGAQNRRARKRNAPGAGVSTSEWRSILEAHGYRCAYCGCAGPMQMEHAIPLARGGAHDPSNVVPSCAECNMMKHTRTPAEFEAYLVALSLESWRRALSMRSSVITLHAMPSCSAPWKSNASRYARRAA